MGQKKSIAQHSDRIVLTARAALIAGGALALFLASCAPPPRPGPPPTADRGSAGHARGDSAQRTLGPGLVDTEGTLTRDRWSQTWNDLYALRNQIRRFMRAHERLPARIEEFVVAGGVEYERDGWGNLIRYTLMDTGFELRSAGADGEMGTADDLVATPDRMPPRTWP